MEKNDKDIEALIDKLMAADALEQPSLDFTEKVMARVETISNSTVTAYKPLIPKYVWYIILGGFAVLVGYLYTKDPSANNDWLERFNITEIGINPFEELSLNFSKSLLYAMILLVIMISIQIPILKQYFNKRISF